MNFAKSYATYFHEEMRRNLADTVFRTQSATLISMNEHINLPTHTQAMPFSDAVWAGDLLYLSGRIGVIPGTRKLPREATEEARLLLDGVREVLAAASLTMDDLVFVQVSTPDV